MKEFICSICEEEFEDYYERMSDDYILIEDEYGEYYYLDQDGGINMAYDLKYVECHTEEFIRSVSDDLWLFAVEVAE